MNVGAMAISDTEVRFFDEDSHPTEVSNVSGYGKIIGSVQVMGGYVTVPTQAGTQRWMVTIDMRGHIVRATALY